jgi:hypothetical protein
MGYAASSPRRGRRPVAAYSSASHCTNATAGYLAPADLVTEGIEGAGQALQLVQLQLVIADGWRLVADVRDAPESNCRTSPVRRPVRRHSATRLA